MLTLTTEEKERAERLFQAEIKKLELTIENTKQELLELKKPKVFLLQTILKR